MVNVSFHRVWHTRQRNTARVLLKRSVETKMLAWTIYISFIGVAVLTLLPKANASAVRKVALLTALMFVIGLWPQLILQFTNATVAQMVEQLKF